MTAVVPPRVVPLLVSECRTTSTGLRRMHLKHFYENLEEVFKCRVEVDDVSDLLVFLFSELANAVEVEGSVNVSSRSVATAAAPELTEELQLQFLILRIFKEMFTEGHHFSPLCFKGLKRLALKVLMVREDAATKQSSATAAAASEDNEASDAPRGDSETPALQGVSPIAKRAPNDQTNVTGATEGGPVDPNALVMDGALSTDVTRSLAVALLRAWDAAGIDVSCFSATPETIHLYVPQRLTSSARVYRDFLTCSRRPKLTRTWGSFSCVHIKTNIPAKSDIMYRFLIEGYNYGVNAVIHNDVVGYTNRRWDSISQGNMAQYGYPEGWDREMCNDYTPGCTVQQYYTTDRYVALRLKAKSMFCVGFSVSGWLVFHGYGNGFPLAGEVFHQDADL